MKTVTMHYNDVKNYVPKNNDNLVIFDRAGDKWKIIIKDSIFKVWKNDTYVGDYVTFDMVIDLMARYNIDAIIRRIEKWDYNVSIYPIAPSDTFSVDDEMVIIADWNSIPESSYRAIETILESNGYILGWYDAWVTSDYFAYYTQNYEGNHFIVCDGYIIGDDDENICDTDITELANEFDYYGPIYDMSSMPKLFDCFMQQAYDDNKVDSFHVHVLEMFRFNRYDVERFYNRHIKRFPRDLILHNAYSETIIIRNWK